MANLPLLLAKPLFSHTLSDEGPLGKVHFDDMPRGLLALNARCNSKDGDEDGRGESDV